MKNSFFRTSNLLRWAFGIAIVLILNLFFVVSTQLVSEKPEYNDFCIDKQVRIIPQNQDECVELGGQWTEDRFIQKGLPTRVPGEIPVIKEEVKGYCNTDFTCRGEYTDARKVYERNFFVTLVILGTLTLIVSFIFRSLAVVAPALATGGVLAYLIASIRYWSDMSDYLRVIVLGIALITLIFVGVKKFQKAEEDEKNNLESSE